MSLPRRAVPLILFPGLAADDRLFGPQRLAFPRLIVPEWIRPASGGAEPLEQYARRLARELAPRVPAVGPYLLGGFSFGSMVAQELIGHLPRRPAALVLICGIRGRHQILPGFVAQQTLGALIPPGLARRLYGPFARRFAARERLNPTQTELLVDMATRNDPAFLNWSARACTRWLGRPPRPPGLPVIHIHGERDRVIPDVRREATHTISGAGHLVTLTHAERVNEVIAETMAGVF